MANLDQASLDLLDRSIEVDVRTPRRDGSMSSRPIWIVVVDGTAYVRSYLGERGAWYRRARADGGVTLVADDRTLDVGVEPVGDEELNHRISDAFRAKYGERSPQSTEAMVVRDVVATTLRLT
jgi:hypothetical protein